MTLANQEPEKGGLVPISPRRTLNLRAGIDLDEETTEGIIMMAEGATPEMYFDDYGDSLALNNLQRYSINRDSKQFNVVDNLKNSGDWEKIGSIEGVVLAAIPHRVMRENVQFVPDQDNPILCVSGTGETGTWDPEGDFPPDYDRMKPTGNCSTCPYGDWEWAKSIGLRSPRCSDRLRLFIKTPEYGKPVVLDLPGSYRKSWREYTRDLKNKLLREWEVVTVMTVAMDRDNRTYLVCEEAGLIDTTKAEVVDALNKARAICNMLVEDAQTYHLRSARRSTAPTGEQQYTVEGEVVSKDETAYAEHQRQTSAAPLPDGGPPEPFREVEAEPAPAPEPAPEPAKPMSPLEAARARIQARNAESG